MTRASIAMPFDILKVLKKRDCLPTCCQLPLVNSFFFIPCYINIGPQQNACPYHIVLFAITDLKGTPTN